MEGTSQEALSKEVQEIARKRLGSDVEFTYDVSQTLLNFQKILLTYFYADGMEIERCLCSWTASQPLTQVSVCVSQLNLLK